MEKVLATCSKCRTQLQAIPGTTHQDCGGTFVPLQMKREFKFSTPLAMTVFMMLDRLVNDTGFTAGQFMFMNQPNLAQAVDQLSQAAAQLRDRFYQQDQGGIVVVGADKIPKS